MRLNEVIQGIAIVDRRGQLSGDVTSVVADSRQAKPGSLFVAVKGSAQDGHDFIKAALQKGAVAVLCETWKDEWDPAEGTKPEVVIVQNARRALALAAGNFYGQPSRKLLVAGVTGTNGKTTVTYILESIMKAASRNVGVIGTVDCRFAGKSIPLGHTTPDAIMLQKVLSEMVAAGVTHVAMEVSSHALDQARTAGVHYKVCGFTNLTQDHLDYHKTLDSYFEAKAKLFSESLRKSRARGRMAVVNVDDPRGQKLVELWGGKSLRVSLDKDKEAELVALDATYSLTGTKATVRTPKGVWDLDLPLIGPHNLSNALVAMGIALAMGFSRARIVRGLRALERVPGRLEPVPSEEGKKVFVDYAHTPDGLVRVLSAMRPLTKGRLIVVFGCGGDRDREKRPLMGKAVAEHADLAVLTNDNPRTEDPVFIARAVEEGLKSGGMSAMEGPPRNKTYKIELDRRHAIRSAVGWLNLDDVLIVAGKGHENYQIIGSDKRAFDDREEARRALAGLPPPPPPAAVPSLGPEPTMELDAAQVVEAVEEPEEIAPEDVEEAKEPPPPEVKKT